MRRILSARTLYVNKIPINFVGIKQISARLRGEGVSLDRLIYAGLASFSFWLDAAALHGASVEQEGW